MLAAMLLLVITAAPAADWRRDSPRKASASVSMTNGLWCISVSFAPVTSFDKNKNILENQRMAQAIAEWALLKELRAEPFQVLETSGLQKTAFYSGKDSATAIFSVPVNSVRLVERKELISSDSKLKSSMPTWPETVTSVKICDSEIEAILRRHPFIVETGGAKVFHLEDGRVFVVAIGMTDAANPAVSRLTIAESKARAALVSKVNGVRVLTETRLSEKSVSKISEKGEATFEVSESTECIESKALGGLRGLEIVGTWVLKDENMFCLAIGRIVAADEWHSLFHQVNN